MAEKLPWFKGFKRSVSGELTSILKSGRSVSGKLTWAFGIGRSVRGKSTLVSGFGKGWRKRDIGFCAGICAFHFRTWEMESRGLILKN